MKTMTEAERFFYEHAAYAWRAADGQSEEEGHRESARRLAAAEARLKSGPYFIGHEPDEDPWDGDMPYDGPLWNVDLYSVADSLAPVMLGSLGSVACEEGDPYMRVVAAELAAEYIPDEEG